MEPPARPCGVCGETSPRTVRFCPFCGTLFAPADPPAAGATKPAPVRPLPVAMSSEAITTGAPSGPSSARPAWVKPPISPLPVSPLPVSPAPITPPPAAAPTRVRVPRRPRPPPRPLTVAQHRARALAVRQLRLACAILLGGALVWRLLIAGPHGDVVVAVVPAAAGTLFAPAGTVLVDGVGSGTAGEPIRLPPGRHVIGFAAEAWSTPLATIRLHAGETRRVLLHPVPHHAELSLDSVPSGALLELHDATSVRRLGHAPTDLALPPGDYRVTAMLPGYQPLDQPLALAPGEHSVLALALAPDPVRTLHLLAPPAGAWSTPVTLDPGDRFTVAFQGRIRLRAAGQVMLLDGPASDLGTLDGRSLEFASVDDTPVPVDLLVRKSGPPG